MNREAAAPDGASGYHVLAAVGEESQLAMLLSLARTLAASGQGRVTLLSVTADGSRPKWLRVEEGGDPPIRVEVRRGEETADEILDAVRELEPDLLLIGWSGGASSRRHLLGSTLDPVVRFAPCNVAVVRGDKMGAVEKALVAAGGGPNAALAIDLALRISPETQVTALYVARDAVGPVGLAAGREQLDGLLEPWADEARIRPRVVRAGGVIDGILHEAGRGYDLLLIGASNENYVERRLFGDVPQQVGAEAPVPTLIVRRRAGPLKSFLRQAERVLSEASDLVTMGERVETYREVRRGARPRLDFFVMLGSAAAIAALGLIMDSPAVTIGAMIIAPLMSAIFGISLGIVMGDTRLLWQASGTTLEGAALAIGVGALLALLVPFDEPTGEILSRSQPLLLDLVVALVSGLAGAYAQCRRSLLSSLAGVAIAVALVPPLATTGIGLMQRDGPIASGALLLFLTNLSAIIAAGSVVFLLFGFRPDPGRRVRVFSRSMIGVLILLSVVSGTLTWLTVRHVRDTRMTGNIEAALHAELDPVPGVDLDSWQVIEQEGDRLLLDVRVRATQDVAHDHVDALQRGLTARLDRPVHMRVTVTRITRLDGPDALPTAAAP